MQSPRTAKVSEFEPGPTLPRIRPGKRSALGSRASRVKIAQDCTKVWRFAWQGPLLFLFCTFSASVQVARALFMGLYLIILC